MVAGGRGASLRDRAFRMARKSVAAECGSGRGVLHTMDSGRISMPPTQEEV